MDGRGRRATLVPGGRYSWRVRRAALGLAVTLGCSGGTGTSGGGAITLGQADSTGRAGTESTAAATGVAATTADDSSDGPGATSTTGETSSTGGSDDTTTTGANVGPDYLLSIDDQGVVARLLRVDTNTGIGDELCLLEPNLNYNSLAFSRDGVLYAHSVIATAIDRVDPCTCETIRIVEGLTGNVQLTADEANGLYGLDLTADELVQINPSTGAVTLVGAVGQDFTSLGIAYSDVLGGVYAVNGETDELWTIDTGTGAAISSIAIGLDFGAVGLDYHPGQDVLYACTSDATLYTVQPRTGDTQPVGVIGGAICDNIAAPWRAIACVDP